MIKYCDKTVFNSNCEGIVNTVNCVGAMGTGLALEFALRYPNMEKQYEKDCMDKKVKTGEIITYKENDVLIINFPTKYHWKYPSQIRWISDGLDFLVKHYKEWNIKSIAIPPLGCTNGGLDYVNQVKPLIESKLKNLEIDVCLCVDPGYAEGKEKEMLDAFNNSDVEAMCIMLDIKRREKKALQQKENITRFFMIKSMESIGIKTYTKLFNYFYNNGKAFKPFPKKESLFDNNKEENIK